MNNSIVKSVVALALASTSLSAFSAQSTAPAKITRLLTNWGADQMIVSTAAPVVNPDGCRMSDGYATAGDASGRSQQAFLLTALSADLPIYVTVQGCIADRPAILGISASPN
ncbi:hypothetical protein [Burkholderia sp. BCC0405]|uniref:hypothetical protein n=1 Tax=Burkholderia sp. BCC0405 TaxID=2676298 RepID=UPI001588A75C|nr:hypothetical protein [Burkholderia sp. BCC0405]